MPKITAIPYKKLVRIFETLGFVHDRTNGDHLMYTKASFILQTASVLLPNQYSQ